MALLARLKPYNVRKGHTTRIYSIDGTRFYEERGWYEVSDDLGDKLRDLHQDHYDLDSPDLFDVCTQEEAEELERREAKQVEVKSTARRPVNVTGRRSAAAVSGRESREDEVPRSITVFDATQVNNELGDGTSAGLHENKQNQPPTGDLRVNEVRQGVVEGPNGERPAIPETDTADEGRALEVGRVTSKSNPPPKHRQKRG